jgi:DNA-binding MarR family transcriptional regulator
VPSTLERRAAEAMWTVFHRSRARMRDALGEHDLTPRQAMVLRAVAARDGLSPGQLADLSGVTPATATGILDGLEARGLLRRARRPEDRRGVRIVLTPAGRRLSRAIAEAGASGLTAELRRLRPEEARRLVALLEKLAGTGAGGEDGGHAPGRARRRRAPSR